jgi:hypothetical protein
MEITTFLHAKQNGVKFSLQILSGLYAVFLVGWNGGLL